jgi:hypothetical protein
MRRFLCHALIVTAFLLGGDWSFNDGRDTEALLSALRADVVAGGAQLQAHRFNAAIERQLAVLGLR